MFRLGVRSGWEYTAVVRATWQVATCSSHGSSRVEAHDFHLKILAWPPAYTCIFDWSCWAGFEHVQVGRTFRLGVLVRATWQVATCSSHGSSRVEAQDFHLKILAWPPAYTPIWLIELSRIWACSGWEYVQVGSTSELATSTLDNFRLGHFQLGYISDLATSDLATFLTTPLWTFR